MTTTELNDVGELDAHGDSRVDGRKQKWDSLARVKCTLSGGCAGRRRAPDQSTGGSGCWATAGPLVAHHVALPVKIREFGATRSRFRIFGSPVRMVGMNPNKSKYE